MMRGNMFNKEIDVVNIMKEIQQKAKNRRDKFNSIKEQELEKNKMLISKIEEISAELNRINEHIIRTYNYTKEHEETAIELHRNLNKSKFKQKMTVFIRRCARRLTRYIWIEQNEVNKSLNENIKALYDSQIEITKSLVIINDIINSQIKYNNELIELKYNS